jgi:thiol-disulfide isomerase/thioredoxin
VLADLLLRALWAVLIASTVLILYRMANRVIVARARGRRLGLENLRPGVPAILYFTTPGCVPCKTVQRPALARLQEVLGHSIQVIEVDAAAQPELADYWGVLSVPTTFIIDTRGQARRVNHGVASAEKLEKQIEDIADKPNFLDNLKTMLHKYQS